MKDTEPILKEPSRIVNFFECSCMDPYHFLKFSFDNENKELDTKNGEECSYLCLLVDQYRIGLFWPFLDLWYWSASSFKEGIKEIF